MSGERLGLELVFRAIQAAQQQKSKDKWTSRCQIADSFDRGSPEPDSERDAQLVAAIKFRR